LTGRETQKSGIFELGYNQTIGYYDQEQQLLDQNNSVIDEIWSVYSDKTNTQIRSMLARFGFKGDDVFKSVSVLSGGERARLSIAKMVACGVSLLILDEPTNHLDIDSCEMLESALREYDGTIITVSHDRYFIQNLATAILEIDKTGFDLGYSFKKCSYIEYIEKNKKNEITTVKRVEGIGKTDFEEAKQRKNQLRSAKNRFANVEKSIAELENQLSELKRQENDESITSDYVALNALFERKNELESNIDTLYEELERLENIILSNDE
jgi:ATP-binding cassette subfamily F protein 3